MNKLLLAVLFVASFSVFLGANQEAFAGACQDDDKDGFYHVSAPPNCNPGSPRDCDDMNRNIFPGNGCPDNRQVIGGEIIPINFTLLYIAGIQTSTSLLIPTVLLTAGIGLLLVRRK